MWIESISVRTARPKHCAILQEELGALCPQRQPPRMRWIACYQNLDVENELSIHLGWEENDQPPQKSDFGLRIARYLNQHGLVHHTLWKLARYFPQG